MPVLAVVQDKGNKMHIRLKLVNLRNKQMVELKKFVEEVIGDYLSSQSFEDFAMQKAIDGSCVITSDMISTHLNKPFSFSSRNVRDLCLLYITKKFKFGVEFIPTEDLTDFKLIVSW